MKFAFSLFLIITCCFQLKAQTDEHIQERSGGYMEKRNQQTTIRSIRIKPAIPLAFASTATHLVVIDGKIYKGTDPYLKSIDQHSLEFVDNVKDNTSRSGTKHIVFYRTRVKAKD